MKIWLLFTFLLVLIVASAILVRDSLVYKIEEPLVENCQAVCLGVSSDIEGWYNTCSGNLIKADNCIGEKPRPLDFPGFTSDADLTDLSNPATEFCREQKGSITSINKFGRDYIVCNFSDQTQCEAWSYLRGQCQVGDYKDFTQSLVVYAEPYLGINITMPLLWLSTDPKPTQVSIAEDEYPAVVFYLDNEELFTLIKVPKDEYNILDFADYKELKITEGNIYLYQIAKDDSKLQEIVSKLQVN